MRNELGLSNEVAQDASLMAFVLHWWKGIAMKLQASKSWNSLNAWDTAGRDFPYSASVFSMSS